ncbi:MAG: PQQ-binding-like beta-propeller repeat protein [Gammaproteobacteria bacterium]|nr:PQQ-binding-like beta-propeller repeat protein [Gammaproteobacteria bacterium]
MLRRRPRRGPTKAWLAAVALALVACTPKTPDTDWPTYLGDAGRGHYSELTEINPTNVARLAVAWRYDAGELQPGVSVMDTSPLVVGGVLFGLSPTLDAFALDAASGVELWRSAAPGAADVAIEHSQRGMLWWAGAADAGDAEAGLYYVAGTRLVALDPRTGKARTGFGVEGRLDLATVAPAGVTEVAGPGLVVDERILLALKGTKATGCGAVIAVNASGGGLAWRADLCELVAGNPSTAMAFDAGQGLVFVPAEAGGVTPTTPDAPVSGSLLALDAATGEVRWRQSIYRRESWPGRLASPPVLVRVPHVEQEVDAVALATRRGHLFLFDTGSGAPLHPTVEQHGEAVSALTLVRQTFVQSERPAASGLAGRVASLQAALWTLPTTAGTLLFPGVQAGAGWGGAAFDPISQRLILNVEESASVLRLIEVPAGFSERNVYFAHCARCHGADRKGLYQGRADRYGAGGPSLVGVGERMSERNLHTVIARGRGSMPGFDQLPELERIALVDYLREPPDDFSRDDRTTERSFLVAEPVTLRDAERLPGNAPPWGSLVAFDLGAGKPAWQLPFCEYPSRPGLGFGAENTGGAVVTAAGLVFIAATPDMKMRAFDASDGALLWESELSAGGFGTPAVYAAGGRQFVAIAAGGGRLGPPSGSEYIAFALPD